MPSFRPNCRAKGKVIEAGGMATFDLWRRTAFSTDIRRQRGLDQKTPKKPKSIALKLLKTQAAALK